MTPPIRLSYDRSITTTTVAIQNSYLKGPTIMMATGKRLFWILTMGAFLVMSSGCTQTRLKLVESEIGQMDSELHTEKGKKIEGYRLRNGTAVEFKGRVHLAGQDSLRFWLEKDSGGVGYGYGSGPVFETGDVIALEVQESDVVSTLFLLVPIFVVGAIIVGSTTSEYELKPAPR
jgi:hypothetical protein